MLSRRRRARPAARIALIKKYLASGLTQREFCQQEKLAYPTFLAWLRKYCIAEGHAPNSSASAPSFIPLQIAPPARHTVSRTLVYPNGVLVDFSGDIDEQRLARLLRVAGDEARFRSRHVSNSIFIPMPPTHAQKLRWPL